MENPVKFIIKTISGRNKHNKSFNYYPSKAQRHQGIDIVKIRKRRAKNKLATKSRRINRLTRKH